MEKEFTKSYAIKRIAELTQQIIDLEIKLEEKQEEIEEWRSLYSALMKDCQMQIEEYNKIKNQLSDRESRWAKYSKNFCIERLEEVKELIKNMSIGIGIEIYGTRIKPVEEYIDCQIEELKKGSEQNDK